MLGEPFLNSRTHCLDLMFRQVWIDRQRQDPVGQFLGDGKVAAPITKRRVGGLQVERHRIMNTCSNPSSIEMIQQAVAILSFYHEQVIDVRSARQGGAKGAFVTLQMA